MMCCSCNVGESCQVCGKHPNVTGSWSNDAELIDVCMHMLEDVPGETLDKRVECLMGWFLYAQEHAA